MIRVSLGDTVQLKSGGPIMTVESSSDGVAECKWFDKDRKIRVHNFGVHSLTKDFVRDNGKPVGILEIKMGETEEKT